MYTSIFESRALVLSVIGFSWIVFVNWGFLFWIAPYLLRAFDVSAGEVGTSLGLATAAGGWIGVIAGGVISDRLVVRTRWARMLVGLAVAVLAPPVAMAMLSAKSIHVASVMYFLFMVVSNLAIGPASANVNELVPARVRGTASALYLLSLTFIGQALGPYAVGKMSDALSSAGASGPDALRSSLTILLFGFAVGFVFLVLAGRSMPIDRSSSLQTGE